jgi:tRNA threonylcarbamoyladenosine biosynthesis protein TsaB
VARDGTVLAEDAEPASRSHVSSLPALVDRVLARAGLAIGDVEGLGVSIGPGSFTGLRIGLGLAKGIAFAGGLPLAAVPTLEALAEVAGAQPGQTVCAALDARKQEVYAALFRAGATGLERVTDDLAVAPGALAERLSPGTLLVGDAAEAYPEAFGSGLVRLPFATHHPRGGVLARLGDRLLAAGRGSEPGALEPVYVRPSEAELTRMPASGRAR